MRKSFSMALAFLLLFSLSPTPAHALPCFGNVDCKPITNEDAQYYRWYMDHIQSTIFYFSLTIEPAYAAAIFAGGIGIIGIFIDLVRSRENEKFKPSPLWRKLFFWSIFAIGLITILYVAVPLAIRFFYPLPRSPLEQ